MPAQYSGSNKVGNVPVKIRKPGMGSAPRGQAFATPANDNQSNRGVGSGGSTRIGRGGLAAIPGTSMKRFAPGKTTPHAGKPHELPQTAASRPFNAMKQRGLAKALRSRSGGEPYNQGGV